MAWAQQPVPDNHRSLRTTRSKKILRQDVFPPPHAKEKKSMPVITISLSHWEQSGGWGFTRLTTNSLPGLRCISWHLGKKKRCLSPMGAEKRGAQSPRDYPGMRPQQQPWGLCVAFPKALGSRQRGPGVLPRVGFGSHVFSQQEKCCLWAPQGEHALSVKWVTAEPFMIPLVAVWQTSRNPFHTHRQPVWGDFCSTSQGWVLPDTVI